MGAPVIVALSDDYIGSVTAYLQGRLRTDDVTVEAIRDALFSAARYEPIPEPEPDLFGGAS